MNQIDIFNDEINYKSTNDFQNSISILDLSFEKEQNLNNKYNFTQLSNIFNEQNNSDVDELFNNNFIEENIILNSLSIPKPIQTINQKTLLGRKKKNSGEIGKHNKNSEDNLTRKMKVIIKNDLLDYINKKIKKKKISNIIINDKMYDKNKIKLLNIKQKQMKDTTVEGNQQFLNTKIKDIFSDETSGNYSNYPSNFNALLIEKIYQSKNMENITSILDKTFLECLKYYRKDEDIINDSKYECLKGLDKNFEELKDKIMEDNDEKYADDLIKLIKEFEIIYFNKKSRAKRAKKHYKII